MSDPNQSQLILAVPGPEQMRAYPKEVVQAAIVNGEIGQSQLIWSPLHNEWKKLRELTHLHPAQEGEAVETSAPHSGEEELHSEVLSEVHPEGQMPLEEEVHPVEEQPVETAAVAATPALARPASKGFVEIPPVTMPQAQPQRRKKHQVSEKEMKDFEESHVPITTWIIIFLSSIILGTLGSNYYLVDTPFRNNLAHYELEDLPLHAHLVSFYRSDMILFHLFPDPRITEEKLPDLLVKMAKSTPNQALSGQPFAWVSLSKGWYSQYSLPGESWAKLGTMEKATRNEKIAFLLDRLEDKNGMRLLKPVQVDKPQEVVVKDETPAPAPAPTTDPTPAAAPVELTDAQKKAWDQFAYSLVQ